MKSLESLAERGEETNGPDDERTVVHLMVDQIEFANVILLNKVFTWQTLLIVVDRSSFGGANREDDLLYHSFKPQRFNYPDSKF